MKTENSNFFVAGTIIVFLFVLVMVGIYYVFPIGKEPDLFREKTIEERITDLEAEFMPTGYCGCWKGAICYCVSMEDRVREIGKKVKAMESYLGEYKICSEEFDKKTYR